VCQAETTGAGTPGGSDPSEGAPALQVEPRGRLASNLAASNLVAVEDEPSQSEETEEPIILASAFRHGVSEDDMLRAVRFAIHHLRQDDDMVMFIGPSTSGDQLVEVGVVIWWGGELAIVHAMRPARDKYLR
jgi:hypothetical protein